MTPEQSLAFQKVFDKRESVFITGPAGTGKTFWIQRVYEECRRRGDGWNIQITAMTGTAAILLNELSAMTFHSWSMIGINELESGESRFRSLTRQHFLLRNPSSSFLKIQSTDILVIDEISMMSPALLTKFDSFIRLVRKNPHKPFGGLQIIFVGDFYQLPPVSSSGSGGDELFVFSCDAWRQLIRRRNQCIVFQKNYRQEGDELFTWILNQIRCGILTSETQEILRNKLRSAEEDSLRITRDTGIIPTKLYPTRALVEIVNREEMEKLDPETERVFRVSKLEIIPPELDIEEDFHRLWTPEMIAEKEYELDNSGRYHPELRLRIGSQVMCTANLDVSGGIVNGTRGIVMDIGGGGVNVRLLSGKVYRFTGHQFVVIPLGNRGGQGVFRVQIPLVPAWGITIHKSQGQSIDCAEMDIGKRIFETGQGYVALSRVRSLDGLILRDFHSRSIRVAPEVNDFAEAIGDNVVRQYIRNKNRLLIWGWCQSK
jgi:ATP-dependent DNA helicase PIF1